MYNILIASQPLLYWTRNPNFFFVILSVITHSINLRESENAQTVRDECGIVWPTIIVFFLHKYFVIYVQKKLHS